MGEGRCHRQAGEGLGYAIYSFSQARPQALINRVAKYQKASPNRGPHLIGCANLPLPSDGRGLGLR
jgi:hypothetical protein